MKASELRIGNWINIIGLVPTQVVPKHIEFIAEGDDQYDPIPLTEEWLLKFGFKLRKIDKDDTFQRYHLLIPRTGWYLANTITYGSVTLWNKDHTSTGVGAQYVHELQNLYFALTGEELTTKEGTECQNAARSSK